MSAKEEYEIGYKKPPKDTRFRKGHSGNPKGRKKRETIDDFRGLVERIFAEEVDVRIGGKVRSMTRLEAMYRALQLKALQGNRSAILRLIRRAQKVGLFSKSEHQSFIVLTDPQGEAGNIIRMHQAELASGEG